MAVVSLVGHQHLSHHPLDKEIAERWLKNFVKALDPIKVYFYQSDIDEFARHKDELIGAARNGDISFAYMVFRRLLQRVDESVSTVDQLLAMPQDFTVDEELLIDRETATQPRDAAEARDFWRKRVKYDLLLLESEKKLEGKGPARNCRNATTVLPSGCTRSTARSCSRFISTASPLPSIRIPTTCRPAG